MSLKGIDGKVAIVTGGASGIGEGTSRRLSEEGAKVVVVDWNEQALDAVAGSLPGPTVGVRADVSLEEDVEGYMRAALEAFGRVDLVHLNAGISGTFAPFTQVTTDQFDRVIAVNLRSVFFGLRSALRQMEEQGEGGAIVTTSSLAGLSGGETIIPYIAAKHGVIGLTKAAAVYGARIGVRVNTIAPGLIEIGLTKDLEDAIGQGRKAIDALAASLSMSRFGSPAEAGALVTYLLSEDASYVTGIVIPIDGGLSAGAPLTVRSPVGGS